MSKDCTLIVAFEGPLPKNLDKELQKVSFYELDSKNHRFFLEKFGKLSEANGFKIVQTKNILGQSKYKVIKHMKYDLVRFSFKIFSIDFILTKIENAANIAWIDADTVCLKPFFYNDLLPFFPKQSSNEIMSYLGRTHYPKDNPYSECGFLGFNLKSPFTQKYLNRMKDLYMSGEAFRYTEWHDSWLWDQTRNEFEQKGFQFRDISGQFSNLEHPFVNSGLGEFFDHLKGDRRKALGKSLIDDFVK